MRRGASIVAIVAALTWPAWQANAATPEARGGFPAAGWSPLAIDAPPLKRYAVVIGNGSYAAAPDLPNAVADARLIAPFLAENGYDVLEFHDLGKRGFERMLRQVLREVDHDSEVVFYYAGHGLQIAGGNYLVPVDARLDDAYDVPFETISLTSIVNILGARARMQMVILDSCRDNPFGNTRLVADLSSGLSEVRDGFTALTAPINSLLAFSTSPGAVALDGDGSNSPFTLALVEAARASPDLPVAQLFERVRRLVYDATEGRQVPWESSTLVEPAAFRRAGPPVERGGGAGEGTTRGLAIYAVAQALTGSPAEAEAAPEDGPVPDVVLSAPLEPEIRLGPALAEALALEADDTVEVVVRPDAGRLTVAGPAGRFDATGARLAGDRIEDLVYTAMVETGAEGEAPAPLGDRFVVAAGGEERVVELALEPDPCDFEAGDHLDPDGVGLARYPNELAPERAREACLAAVAAYPEVGRFHYQLGRAELALLDLDAAEAAFERAAQLGHTRAWYALGSLVAKRDAATGGRVDARAPAAALDLYRIGVDRGDAYAMHALGVQLLRHPVNEAERRAGFDLLSRALELGHTFSMNALGYYFLDEASPHSDPARGLRYLRESADRGDIYGYHNLGYVALNGLAGQPRDPQAARDWFERAATGGHPGSPGSLGRLYNSGALGSPDHAEALEWFDVGLERGDGWSGVNGAAIVMNGWIPGATYADAAIRAAKAAALSDPEAGARAREQLAEMPIEGIDAAAQMLVNDLGGSVPVDGAFGPASAAEMDRVLGAGAVAGDGVDRLVGLAAAYWRASRFRVDLY